MKNRIMVIGCPGGGKSTFSRELAKRTGIPLYHLDMLYWNEDKTHIPKEVFRERLIKILETEKWIIDGNYGSTLELRMAVCDTVFFLDYPLDVCMDGVMSRFGKPRPDMPWVETEWDKEFLEFIKAFEKESRPHIYELLEKYREKEITVLRSREEAAQYLEKIDFAN